MKDFEPGCLKPPTAQPLNRAIRPPPVMAFAWAW